MAEQPRDDAGRYASTETPAPRTRFGVGEPAKSRSAFADGAVMSPRFDEDRSRFGAGPVRKGDATHIVAAPRARIIRVPETAHPGERKP